MQLSVKDAAGILNVPEDTIYQWVRQGTIPFHETNDQIRFNKTELLEWATVRRMEVSPTLFADGDAGAFHLPTLTEALLAGGVVYGVGGTDQASVLRSVVAVLSLPEEVDRDFLYEVLLARETLGSTGIGDGIAIPHVRNPLVLHVPRPSVTLCFLDTPIDFHAIDGKPVDILFTLITPTARVHLHFLSRLGYVLRDAELRAALLRRAPIGELLSEFARIESALPAVSDETGAGGSR